MKPTFTRAILDCVSERVARYPELCPENLAGYDQEVTKYRAIPVAYDMWAVVFLSVEGSFFALDPTDKTQPPIPIESTCFQLVTLRLASREYPELLDALPERTPDAVECSHCAGRGFVPVNKVRFMKFEGVAGDTRDYPCWPCGTLGWYDSAGPVFPPQPPN